MGEQQPPRMVVVIGKCPVTGCKTRNRGEFPATYSPLDFLRPGDTKVPGWTIPGCPVRMSDSTFNAYSPAAAQMDQWPATKPLDAAGWVCEEHDLFLVQKQVSGTVNTGKKCGSICKSAASITCDCVCGGSNHGRRLAK